MANDEYPPNRLDPLKEGVLFNAMACRAMMPTFTFSSHTLYGRARPEERRGAQDWRDERLARAAYLLIVGIERAVRAVASLVSRVGSYAARRVPGRGRERSTECEPAETVTPNRQLGGAMPAGPIEVESSR
jgi:hypothetical protein